VRLPLPVVRQPAPSSRRRLPRPGGTGPTPARRAPPGSRPGPAGRCRPPAYPAPRPGARPDRSSAAPPPVPDDTDLERQPLLAPRPRGPVDPLRNRAIAGRPEQRQFRVSPRPAAGHPPGEGRDLQIDPLAGDRRLGPADPPGDRLVVVGPEQSDLLPGPSADLPPAGRSEPQPFRQLGLRLQIRVGHSFALMPSAPLRQTSAWAALLPEVPNREIPNAFRQFQTALVPTPNQYFRTSAR